MKYILFVISAILLFWAAISFKNFREEKLGISATTPSPIKAQTTSPATSKGPVPPISLHLPASYTIHVFASGLGEARDLQFSPGGTLLVSDLSQNRVFALPDKNHDGVADMKKIIISGENHVHGLTFYNGKLYIADVDQVVRYSWDENTLTAIKDKVLFTLPENADHNNRTIIFNPKGELFVSLGSDCNVCRESSNLGGSILTSDADGNNLHVFANGLRNAAFMAINPITHDLWATEMGRDNLGDNIPPDEINIIHEGKNYGWPNCYGNKVHDTQFDKNPSDPCGSTESPIYEVPAHSAPLGLVFINSQQFSDWQGDLLVTYHGSWNKSTPTGYKIVHMKVLGNTITSVDDFLTGFAPASTLKIPGNAVNSAHGRPVDLTFDNVGNLFVSDDKAGAVYIIQKQ